LNSQSLVLRLEHGDHPGYLEQTEPAACGVDRDSRIIGEGVQVEDLASPSSAEPQKAPEGIEVYHVFQKPQIPLYIG